MSLGWLEIGSFQPTRLGNRIKLCFMYICPVIRNLDLRLPFTSFSFHPFPCCGSSLCRLKTITALNYNFSALSAAPTAAWLTPSVTVRGLRTRPKWSRRPSRPWRPCGRRSEVTAATGSNQPSARPRPGRLRRSSGASITRWGCRLDPTRPGLGSTLPRPSRLWAVNLFPQSSRAPCVQHQPAWCNLLSWF